MITQNEARKLIESMHRELNATPRTWWQCVAGLVIVITLAFAGSAFQKRDPGMSDIAQTQPQVSTSRAALYDYADASVETQLPAGAIHVNTGASDRQ